MTSQEMESELYKGKELSFAIEGRFTNLRVWIAKDANGKHDPKDSDTIFMRLDRAREYSAPFNQTNVYYLSDVVRESPRIQILLKFDFKSPISSLPELLEILKHFTPRECIPW